MSWVLKFTSLEWLFGLHSSEVKLQGWGEAEERSWMKNGAEKTNKNREVMKTEAQKRKENSLKNEA